MEGGRVRVSGHLLLIALVITPIICQEASGKPLWRSIAPVCEAFFAGNGGSAWLLRARVGRWSRVSAAIKWSMSETRDPLPPFASSVLSGQVPVSRFETQGWVTHRRHESVHPCYSLV